MNKTFNIVVSLLSAVFLVFVVVFSFLLVPPEARTANFFLSLAAACLSILMTFGYLLLFRRMRMSSGSAFPVLLSMGTIVILYNMAVLLTIVVGGILFRIPARWYAFIHASLFMLFLAFSAALGLSLGFIRTVSNKNQRNVKGLSLVQNRLAAAVERLQTFRSDKMTATVKRLNRLLEDILCSDPMSRPEAEKEETLFLEKSRELEDILNTLTPESAPEQMAVLEKKVEEVSMALRNRNRALNLTKG